MSTSKSFGRFSKPILKGSRDIDYAADRRKARRKLAVKVAKMTPKELQKYEDKKELRRRMERDRVMLRHKAILASKG